MSNIMVLNYPMFNKDSNLLSIISLILVFVMVFSIFSVAIAHNRIWHPDCAELAETLRNANDGVIHATSVVATAAFVAGGACGITIYSIFFPPVLIGATITCLAALATWTSALWWLDRQIEQAIKAKKHYEEHCNQPLAGGGTCGTNSCSV